MAQLIIKYVNSSYFNEEGLGYFIDTVFENFEELYNFPQLNHNKKEILRILYSENFRGFMAYYGGYLIGYLLGEILTYKNKKVFFINYLYVCPKFRNMHLGTTMINNSKKIVKINNLDGLVLMVDTENEKNMIFYHKLGFTLDADRLNQRHDILVCMRY